MEPSDATEKLLLNAHSRVCIGFLFRASSKFTGTMDCGTEDNAPFESLWRDLMPRPWRTRRENSRSNVLDKPSDLLRFQSFPYRWDTQASFHLVQYA